MACVRVKEEARMGLQAWNVAVLVAVAGMWLATGTHTEKPIVAFAKSDAVRGLEADVAANPSEEGTILKLAQAYLDSRAPGLAVTVIETSPESVRASAKVDHLYARALIEQGRNQDALAAESRVVASCASRGCEPLLQTSALRRVSILTELVRMGIEDADANPDLSSIAYHNATREAHVEVK